ATAADDRAAAVRRADVLAARQDDQGAAAQNRGVAGSAARGDLDGLAAADGEAADRIARARLEGAAGAEGDGAAVDGAAEELDQAARADRDVADHAARRDDAAAAVGGEEAAGKAAAQHHRHAAAGHGVGNRRGPRPGLRNQAGADAEPAGHRARAQQ